MLNDNEFGAPWNNQYYDVRYIRPENGDIGVETMILPGPKEYDDEYLYNYAFEYFNHPLILNIWNW